MQSEQQSNNQKPNDKWLRRLWDNETTDMSHDDINQALGIFRQNRKTYERSRRTRRITASIAKYAAMLALPLITAWAAWNYSAQYYAHESEMMQKYVPEGRTDSLLLSDNTRVIMNAGTSMIYPSKFNNHSLNRNVYVNGSCHFAVAKDRLHPFVVNLGELKVQVLGTHFSVDSYNEDDKITVTLEEGLVRVMDNKQEMTLHPNEQMVYYRKDGRMQKKHVDAIAYNSWTNGNIDFAGQPLGDIIRTLERQYGISIKTTGGINLGRKYTMNFRKGESIDNVLEVLTLVSGNIHYRKDGNTVTLYCTQK